MAGFERSEEVAEQVVDLLEQALNLNSVGAIQGLIDLGKAPVPQRLCVALLRNEERISSFSYCHFEDVANALRRRFRC